jgi:uncharacterized surface protein with fasciclin (FAS1) repeats/Ca2+-binding EF-hand superfamily protein
MKDLQHNMTTTALALLFGLGVAAIGTSASAQDSLGRDVCDKDQDGFIDSQEAYVCGQVRFDELAGDPPYMTQQQFLTELGESDDAEGLFAQADKDGDGQISREEWHSWDERRFAAATRGSGGRMAVADYDRFARGDDTLVVIAAAVEAGDVVAQLRESGEFGTLVRAIEAAGLVEELKDAGPYTVFAPTDDAFNQLPQGKLDQLMQSQDKSRIEDLVMHHIVLGEAHPADALPKQLDPLEGSTIKVNMADDGGAVLQPEGGKQVAISREIPAGNGYIHVVDSVLVPQELAKMLQSGQQQGQQQAQQQSGQKGQQSGEQQASAAGGQQQQDQQQAIFGGGEIASDDWTSVSTDAFAKADADQNGFLTKQELEQWAQTNWGGTPGGGDDDGPLFGLLDVNDDKQVTEDEWFTEESFGALDDDGSGVIENDEFRV